MKSAISIMAGLVLAAPAHAQDEPETASEAVALLIVAAMAPTSYGDWAYRWDAVSARVSSLMHWHLPEPDARDRPGDANIKRNGWVSARGRQVGVSAYGTDDAVALLSFELASAIGSTPPSDDLLVALRAKAVTVTLLRETPDPLALNVLEGASLTYRLMHAERDSADLTRRTSCTSPQSAAAQRCSVTYTLEIGR